MNQFMTGFVDELIKLGEPKKIRASRVLTLPKDFDPKKDSVTERQAYEKVERDRQAKAREKARGYGPNRELGPWHPKHGPGVLAEAPMSPAVRDAGKTTTRRGIPGMTEREAYEKAERDRKAAVSEIAGPGKEVPGPRPKGGTFSKRQLRMPVLKSGQVGTRTRPLKRKLPPRVKPKPLLI
jgi:hypothetical protein